MFLKTGPNMSLTGVWRASTFIITMQQTSPSRSKLMRANLSLAFMLAFSRRSFGRTICPLASMEIIASILQLSLQQSLLMLVTEEAVLSEYLSFSEKSELSDYYDWAGCRMSHLLANPT